MLCYIIEGVIPLSNIKQFYFHFSALVSSDLLVCDTDYWLNISCFLDSRAIPKRKENITYQLEFNMKNDNIKYLFITYYIHNQCIFMQSLAAFKDVT